MIFFNCCGTSQCVPRSEVYISYWTSFAHVKYKKKENPRYVLCFFPTPKTKNRNSRKTYKSLGPPYTKMEGSTASSISISVRDLTTSFVYLFSLVPARWGVQVNHFPKTSAQRKSEKTKRLAKKLVRESDRAISVSSQYREKVVMKLTSIVIGVIEEHSLLSFGLPPFPAQEL